LLFARIEDARYTLVAVNTSDVEQTVPFWFPIAGDYVEELHGGSLDLRSEPFRRRSHARFDSVPEIPAARRK
jgi:hypothetical protein